MQNIYCFRHPQYRGLESPVLSCKTCCSIFVSKIKSDVKNMQTQAKGSQDNFGDWFEEKKAAAAKSVVQSTLNK